MSQALHSVTKTAPGRGVPNSRCLPCLGVSGKTAVVYSCSSRGDCRTYSNVNFKGLKCASVGASFVCEARRNPDISRQSKHGFSRSKHRHGEGKGNFENFEEDMLSSKNGPLTSLSSSSIPKSQATAAPGPKEKEIVELFRKVQARLQERVATKEGKKAEASQGQGRDNGTVDSLLKLLRKHSVEQVKRSSGNVRGKDSILEQDSGQYNEGQSLRFSDLDSTAKDDETREANAPFVTRPRSNFQRRSPIARVKYQPVSYDVEDVNAIPLSSEVGEKNQDKAGLGLMPETDLEPESELEPDPKDDIFFQDVGMDELAEDDTNDSERSFINGDGEGKEVIQNKDLSALKLSELRVLAKSRGLKGFSKMKKGELLELLG
ncbi:rho-N domain-containing protein 1, chloroplastic-like [Prosopis cineraria]|uniref:rho-N domain-containing protein 1, chloroplastic n=1 Tax=Prosopis cineraria TaxID=364024 RepID=UPI00241070DA|nr:rho-N domain-containing protein 1, chloroplastic [Prosopis cineraria]XP_054825280.1 rho-N domain-containing protein 1, chloroplastic-like [Prosopis cineraria]